MKKRTQRTSNIERSSPLRDKGVKNIECGAASRSFLVADIQHRLSATAQAKAEGARLIELTWGKYAIVDAEDYGRLSSYKWCAVKIRRSWYARTFRRDGKQLSMHRLIAGAPKGLFVDHRDHNGLNNRKSNLRLCTRKENQQNSRPRRGGTSRYKGVHWCNTYKKFRAKIYHDGKQIHIGYFDDEVEAAVAYDIKAMVLFGEFAYFNFPELMQRYRRQSSEDRGQRTEAYQKSK